MMKYIAWHCKIQISRLELITVVDLILLIFTQITFHLKRITLTNQFLQEHWEMWFLRLAKSLHKLFRTQFLFGTKIKSTYINILQNTKILDLSEKRGSQRPIPDLGPRQKWVNFPPTFFELFINFLLVCHLLLDIQKKLSYRFFVSAKYGPF